MDRPLDVSLRLRKTVVAFAGSCFDDANMLDTAMQSGTLGHRVRDRVRDMVCVPLLPLLFSHDVNFSRRWSALESLVSCEQRSGGRQGKEGGRG